MAKASQPVTPNPPNQNGQGQNVLHIMPFAILRRDISKISDIILMRELKNRQLVIAQLGQEAQSIQQAIDRRIAAVPAEPDPQPAAPKK